MEPQARSEFVLLYELDGVPHEHVLDEQRVVIGRAKDCNICLAFNSEVSRLHATLTATPDGWVVEDMSSRLGTYVNGEPISEPRRLRDKDVLAIGQVALTLREKKHGTETVSLGSEAKSDFLAAAKARDAAAAALPPASASADAPDAQADSARVAEPSAPAAHSPPANFYELIGVADFEPDLANIQRAAKNRLSELRAGTAPGSHAEQQAQVDAIAAGLAALANPERRRAYDLELAERLGIEVEVRGGRVVPIGQEGFGQLAVGIAIIGVLIVVLWFALPYLRAALAPLFEAPR
jgi:pSer/pThr/pTyr-binding forkhead associated (FHA) protein